MQGNKVVVKSVDLAQINFLIGMFLYMMILNNNEVNIEILKGWKG